MADDEFVKGLGPLLDALKTLAPNVEKDALRTGVFRGAQFLRDKIKAAAPVSSGSPPKGGRFAKYTPGTLKQSIKAKRRRGSKTEGAAGITGAFYAKWVEKGHTLKSHGKNGHVVGHVPANPFVLNAFEANKDQALEEMRKGLAEGVKKVLDKLNGKGPKR